MMQPSWLWCQQGACTHLCQGRKKIEVGRTLRQQNLMQFFLKLSWRVRSSPVSREPRRRRSGASGGRGWRARPTRHRWPRTQMSSPSRPLLYSCEGSSNRIMTTDLDTMTPRNRAWYEEKQKWLWNEMIEIISILSKLCVVHELYSGQMGPRALFWVQCWMPTWHILFYMLNELWRLVLARNICKFILMKMYNEQKWRKKRTERTKWVAPLGAMVREGRT